MLYYVILYLKLLFIICYLNHKLLGIMINILVIALSMNQSFILSCYTCLTCFLLFYLIYLI